MSTISASTTTTTAYKVTADTTGTLVLQTGSTPTTAVTIDGSQNVGIGTGSPTGKLNVAGSGQLFNLNGGGTSGIYSTIGNTGGSFVIGVQNSVGNGPVLGATGAYDSLLGTQNSTNQIFITNNTERMRIDSSGNLLVGTTDSSESSGAGVKVKLISGNGLVSCVGSATNNSSNTFNLYSTGAGAYRFYVEYGGQIRATVTSIAAISDISLKENVRNLETGIQEVMALRPVRFDWKEETKLGTKDIAGFIAQEVEAVMPDLVSDGMYSDTETKKTVRMGDMLPTLVKAIQELKAELDAAKADIATLKGAA